jgi:SAM-dependent methyltransferase
MRSRRGEHGFTSVDGQPDPQRWVQCLNKLHKEPFYISYKARLVELLAPRPGGMYLDVGAGTGADARAVAEQARALVVAVDQSEAMMREASRRGLDACVMASADALPFSGDVFDGSSADRTFQHLRDPGTALDEMIRVTKPCGRIVIVDPDYGTQMMEFPDQELAQRVFRFRADQGLCNGRLAHQMAGMFRDRGMQDVRAEEKKLVVRDAAAVDNVLGLRTWAGSAQARGYLTRSEVATWERLFDEAVAAGRFSWSVSFFLTVGTKPR